VKLSVPPLSKNLTDSRSDDWLKVSCLVNADCTAQLLSELFLNKSQIAHTFFSIRVFAAGGSHIVAVDTFLVARLAWTFSIATKFQQDTLCVAATISVQLNTDTTQRQAY
jgi:hypothetical protein